MLQHPCEFISRFVFQTGIGHGHARTNTTKRGGEEKMLLPEEIKKQIPALYSQENKKDPMVHVKYFDPTGSWTWYVIEGEAREDGDFEFYGLVVGIEIEFGYFTLRELETAKHGATGVKGLPIERDLSFTPRKVSEVKRQAR